MSLWLCILVRVNNFDGVWGYAKYVCVVAESRLKTKNKIKLESRSLCMRIYARANSIILFLFFWGEGRGEAEAYKLALSSFRIYESDKNVSALSREMPIFVTEHARLVSHAWCPVIYVSGRQMGCLNTRNVFEMFSTKNNSNLSHHFFSMEWKREYVFRLPFNLSLSPSSPFSLSLNIYLFSLSLSLSQNI